MIGEMNKYYIKEIEELMTENAFKKLNKKQLLAEAVGLLDENRRLRNENDMLRDRQTSHNLIIAELQKAIRAICRDTTSLDE